MNITILTKEGPIGINPAKFKKLLDTYRESQKPKETLMGRILELPSLQPLEPSHLHAGWMRLGVFQGEDDTENVILTPGDWEAYDLIPALKLADGTHALFADDPGFRSWIYCTWKAYVASAIQGYEYDPEDGKNLPLLKPRKTHWELILENPDKGIGLQQTIARGRLELHQTNPHSHVPENYD